MPHIRVPLRLDAERTFKGIESSPFVNWIGSNAYLRISLSQLPSHVLAGF